MNVKSTKGKKKLEPQSKPKSCAENFKPNNFLQVINSELNRKTTQSGGTKETVNGYLSESGQELLPLKTVMLSVLIVNRTLFGSGISVTPNNGSRLANLVPEKFSFWITRFIALA